MENTNAKTGTPTRDDFLSEEMPRTQHDAARIQYLLQALESFKHEPELKREVDELSRKLQTMDSMLKHTKEADLVEQEKAVREAIERTHVQDAVVLEEAIAKTREAGELTMAKAVQHAHDEGKRIGMADELSKIEQTLHEVQEVAAHLHEMVNSAQTGFLGGFIKLKKDSLLESVSELKHKLDALAPRRTDVMPTPAAAEKQPEATSAHIA